MYFRLLLTLTIVFSIGTVVARADDTLEPPVPVRTVSPKYPAALKTDGVSGVVSINCIIDEKGNVTEPKVVKTSNPAFAEPAMEALSKWKFKPAKRGGVVVPIKITIPIQFSVND
jgi:protein TonB